MIIPHHHHASPYHLISSVVTTTAGGGGGGAVLVVSPSSPMANNNTEDESSITSTITASPVESPAEKYVSSSPTITSAARHIRVRKTVRFNEDCNESYDNASSSHGLYSEDCKQFWYSPRDFQHFKLSSKNEARHFVNADVTFSQHTNILSDFAYPSVIFRAYAACCHWCPLDDDNDNEDDYDETISNDDEHDIIDNNEDSSSTRLNPVLTVEEEQELQKWMQVATSRLGLERHICSDYGTDRSLRRRQVVLIAMDVAMDEEEEAARHGTVLDPQDKAELVKRACQEISRPSRLFAHVMACANYNANNSNYNYSSGFSSSCQ
jgi:hypothetical protein